MLYGTIKIGIRNYDILYASETIISFLIPVVYSILLTPLEYLLELYSKYEVLFFRLSRKEKGDKKIIHRIAIILACNVSIKRVLKFKNEFLGKMYIGMQEDEFKKLVKDFKKSCK